MQGTKQETTTAHKIKPENILLALDIGTEFVKAVIAEKTSDDNLNIIGVAKEHQSMGNMYAGAIADIQAVVSTCEKALSRAEEMAGVVSRTCVVGIAGELIKGNTRTVRYKRKDSNKPISDNEMQQIIQKVQDKAGEQARQEIALETDNPEVEVRLINSAIVSLSIDGYKVSNPIGFKGSDLMIQFYTAFAPLVHISAIEKVCAELNLDLLAVAVEPFAVCRACLGNELDSNFSAIVMDIGGGTTDIAVVDDGGVEGTKMFGIGGRSFTNQIANELSLSYKNAEKLKINLSNEKLKSTIAKQAIDAIDNTLDVWISGVELALSDFENVDYLPSKILLCGGGSSLESLVERLENDDWWQELPFNKKPIVKHIKPSEVSGVIDESGKINDHTFITAMGLLRVGYDTYSTDENASEGFRDKLNRILRA